MAKTTTKARTTGVEIAEEAPTDNLPAPRPRNTVTAIIPQNWQEITTIAAAICRGGMAPKSYCKTDSYGKLVFVDGKPDADQDKVAVAIMHGMEVGLTPMASLQSIAVINGMPSLYGDGMLAVIKASGLLEDIEEKLEWDDQGLPLAATCTMWRKGQKTPITQTYARDDAVKAKLWGKTGPWTDHPGRMLQMRARNWCSRDGFADALRGLHAAEEVQDMVDITPQAHVYTDAPVTEPKRDDPKYQTKSEPAAKVSPTEASQGAAESGLQSSRVPVAAASAGQAETVPPSAAGDAQAPPPRVAGQPKQSKVTDVEDLNQKSSGGAAYVSALGEDGDGIGRSVIGRLAKGDDDEVTGDGIGQSLDEAIPSDPLEYEITFEKKQKFRDLIDFSTPYLTTPGRTSEQANAWYDFYRKQLEYGLSKAYPDASPVKIEVKKLVQLYMKIIA